MKFTNTTYLPDHFLRNMLTWARKEMGVRTTRRGTKGVTLRQAHFGRYRKWYRGTAWKSGRIIVRIAEPHDGYPHIRKYPGRVHSPEFVLNDNLDALVYVTLHELAHLADWDGGTKRVREGRIEAIQLPSLQRFQANRLELLKEWGYFAPVEKPKRRGSVAERNEAKARRQLAAWLRKLALAKTKVKRYRASVKRYDRKKASPGT